MAEAHSAVAFSFSVTPDGVDVKFNHEALKAVVYSGVRSYKKRLGFLKNYIYNRVFPSSIKMYSMLVAVVFATYLAGFDLSFGLIKRTQSQSQEFFSYGLYLELWLFATVLWVVKWFVMKKSLKFLLSYHGWMYESRGGISITTKVWMILTSLFVLKKLMLYTFQSSLPTLPVPPLKDTIRRFLKSVEPLNDKENYLRIERLANEFKDGIGKKLQWYLILKSWWATNYVSDWWEEYVYLRGRSPIMVNSNYYGVDALYKHPSTIQAARAANVVYGLLQHRRAIDRESLIPIMLNRLIPLCSRQYERQFNTTRIPGVEADTLVHCSSSDHIVVYHNGRYFKVYIYFKQQLLKPCQLEVIFQNILESDEPPCPGERELAAMTAVERVYWAKTRSEYFSDGVNKTSLDAIEKAAFVLVLDTEVLHLDKSVPETLNKFAQSMMCGNGHNRWFDKSFTLVVSANGRIGFNAEHSWADAPIMAHLWEETLYWDVIRLGYNKGHTKGELEFYPPLPMKLQWNMPKECQDKIDESLKMATKIIKDVDLVMVVHDKFGKGLIKKCKVSPDAFIQLALQLAYYRDAGKFCLTYEASMTRLFREGRTETVRSCTKESCNFVIAMDNNGIDRSEKIKLMNIAAVEHQQGYRDAMTGKGIDRHLFCLYVVSRYLGVDSAFLKEILSEPWRLSTSQTPHSQTGKIDIAKNPDHLACGGGFGPVADDGYGVSYIVAGEDTIFFHVSSKNSCSETNSTKFVQLIFSALEDMKNLFYS